MSEKKQVRRSGRPKEIEERTRLTIHVPAALIDAIDDAAGGPGRRSAWLRKVIADAIPARKGRRPKCAS